MKPAEELRYLILAVQREGSRTLAELLMLLKSYAVSKRGPEGALRT